MEYVNNYFKQLSSYLNTHAQERKYAKRLSYRGIGMLKNPSDAWNYQELIHENKIQWIIECGTHQGGSAFYFADLLKNKEAEGVVITIDIVGRNNFPPEIADHPKIKILGGKSSVAEETIQEVKKLIQNRSEKARALLILDSNHAEGHVYKELESYIPLLRTGDYLVVEDTGSGGPVKAIRKYLKEYPDKLERDLDREDRMGITYYPEGYYKVK